jgi:hypothetical protein
MKLSKFCLKKGQVGDGIREYNRERENVFKIHCSPLEIFPTKFPV